MHAKLQTEAGQETYNRRMHIGETPFAVIKGIFGVRRFLLRGLEKVRTEWRWVCTAYNLKKLVAALAALRAEGGKMPVSLRGWEIGEGGVPSGWPRRGGIPRRIHPPSKTKDAATGETTRRRRHFPWTFPVSRNRRTIKSTTRTRERVGG